MVTQEQTDLIINFYNAAKSDISRFDSYVAELNRCLSGRTSVEYERALLTHKNYVYERAMKISEKLNVMFRHFNSGVSDYDIYLSIADEITDMVKVTDRDGRKLYEIGKIECDRAKSGRTPLQPERKTQRNLINHTSSSRDYPSSYQPTPQPSPSVSRDSSSDRDDWRSSRDYNPDNRTRVYDKKDPDNPDGREGSGGCSRFETSDNREGGGGRSRFETDDDREGSGGRSRFETSDEREIG